MKYSVILPAALIAGSVAQPAFAQTQPAAPVAAAAAPAPGPVDPALLAKARPIAGVILPDGSFAQIMGPMMRQVMGQMTDSMGKLPVKELARAGGLDPAAVDKMAPARLDDIMAILDPAYRERLRLMTETMFPALGRFMTQFEPDFREGMAEAFATRYDARELDEIAAFVRTPTGAKFGGGFMLLATDPHYLGRMQAMMPKLMQAMPTIMQGSIAAMEKLPKARKYADLSSAERARLAELLGTDPKATKP